MTDTDGNDEKMMENPRLSELVKRYEYIRLLYQNSEDSPGELVLVYGMGGQRFKVTITEVNPEEDFDLVKDTEMIH